VWGANGKWRLQWRLPSGSWVDVPGHTTSPTPYPNSGVLTYEVNANTDITGIRALTPTWHTSDSEGTITACFVQSNIFSSFADNMLKNNCCDKKAYTAEVGGEVSGIITFSKSMVRGWGYSSGGNAGGQCVSKHQLFKQDCLGFGLDVGADFSAVAGYWLDFSKIEGESVSFGADATVVIGVGGSIILGGKNGGDGFYGVALQVSTGAGFDASVNYCKAIPLSRPHVVTTTCNVDAKSIGKTIAKVAISKIVPGWGTLINAGLDTVGFWSLW